MNPRLVWRSIPVWSAVLLVTPAAADPPDTGPPVRTITGAPGRRLAIPTPPARRARTVTQDVQISPIIYLERCTGGCALHMGANDARAGSTSLLKIANATISEFASTTGAIGSAADPEWGQIVQCMKEVYSPYDVVVTDVKPTGGAGYHEAIIAGHPGEVGREPDILGVAPLANDCSAIDNVISLSFANQHTSPTAATRVLNICWTAAQESAHAFGLDHEFSFVAGNRSTCSDPMTYRSDCGGEKFFRDEAARCGENQARACPCGATQNSHQKLLSVFGAGTPITGNPSLTLDAPAAGDAALGSAVVVRAGAKRGVARVELYLNDYNWLTQPGAAILRDGQPDPSTYTFSLPATVPNGIIDVKTIAYDDLGASTTSPVVTVAKGAPCTTADSCAVGQHCAAGRCFWDPPSGELGDRCTYLQSCKSALCAGDDPKICSQPCTPDAATACPTGFACELATATATTGVCLLATTGGCCRVDREAGGGWAQLGIGAAALAFAIRKRRR